MPILPGRHTAQIDGDFVFFLIGMRVNRPWAVHRWGPVARAMPRMLAELSRRPELGLLHAESYLSGRTLGVHPYWRSFGHLHAYAHAGELAHLPAWAAFNRAARGNAAVGLFHETYLVRAGQYECVHVDLPPAGLLRAGRAVPVSGRSETARDRLGA